MPTLVTRVATNTLSTHFTLSKINDDASLSERRLNLLTHDTMSLVHHSSRILVTQHFQ